MTSQVQRFIYEKKDYEFQNTIWKIYLYIHFTFYNYTYYYTYYNLTKQSENFLKKVKSKNERKQIRDLWNILICNVYDLYYSRLNQRREAKCLKLKLFTCLNQNSSKILLYEIMKQWSKIISKSLLKI